VQPARPGDLGAPHPPGTPGAFAPSGRPGDPAGQDIVGRADILERAPGRWSPSHLGSPPRWLLALIAVLVLACGVTAFVAAGLRHGPAPPGRSSAQAAALPTACTYLIGPIGRTALANGRHEPRQDAGCARPGPGQAAASRTTCGYIIGPITGTALAHGTYKMLKGVGCAPPGTGRAGTGGSRPGSSPICVALQVQAGHPATQFGIRHRCYPGLT
jgi:hypothetical protein